MLTTGTVSLVGAGPGDPELITVRGLRLLQCADVIAYDRLVHQDLLREAAPDAERLDVGKEAGRGFDQQAIERLLINRARQGKNVVRLKGGDPFVFGRGGEEMAALIAAGVPVEVVPGITSAIAVPALAGIPVTHRSYSSSITILTGHEDPGKQTEAVDWDCLASTSGTLVILMGLGRLDALCARLIAAGRPAETPAAVIASGSLPDQQTVIASLSDLASRTEQAGVRSPAIVVVGDVVQFATLLERGYGDLFDQVPVHAALSN